MLPRPRLHYAFQLSEYIVDWSSNISQGPILFAQLAIRREWAAVAHVWHGAEIMNCSHQARAVAGWWRERWWLPGDGNAVWRRKRNSISANAPYGIVFNLKRMHPIPRATNSYISIESSFTPQTRWLNAEACHFVGIHRIPLATPWSFLPVKNNWRRTIRGAVK